MQCFDIAGLMVALEGFILSELGGQFLKFLCPPSEKADIRMRFLSSASEPIVPDALHDETVGGERVLHYGDRLIFDYGDEYPISRIVISADYSDMAFYFNTEHFSLPRDNENVERTLQNFLYWGMIGYLTCHDGLMLHSASIVYRNEAVAFSAVSGTGKSTQAGLWKKLYKVKILDGDVNAIRIVGAAPRLYGLPWCGTSGQCLNESAPLRAVVFLEQASRNSVARLPAAEAAMRLAARSRLPKWDKELMQGVFLKTAEMFVAKTDCCLLKCLPDRGAVELMKECLDKNKKI